MGYIKPWNKIFVKEIDLILYSKINKLIIIYNLYKNESNLLQIKNFIRIIRWKMKIIDENKFSNIWVLYTWQRLKIGE